MRIVMVVENAAYGAEFYVDLLSDLGYESRLFPDGGSFLRALSTIEADLVILDRNMGGFDGLDVARRVRALRPDLRILMISGAGPLSAAGAAGGGVIDQVLGKPCTISQFGRAVSELLSHPSPVGGGSPSRAGG